MSKQQSRRRTARVVRTVQGARPARCRTFRVMGSAALIHECSNFVAQLDAHRFATAIVLITLVTLSVVVVALAVTLRAAPDSRDRE